MRQSPTAHFTKRRGWFVLCACLSGGCFRPSHRAPLPDPAKDFGAPQTPSGAAQTPRENLELDLQGSLALLESKSFDLRLARLVQERAAGSVELAKELPNPTASVANTRPWESTNPASLQIGFNVQLPKPWEYDANLKKAELGVVAETLRSAELKRKLQVRIISDFVRIDFARKLKAKCAARLEGLAALLSRTSATAPAPVGSLDRLAALDAAQELARAQERCLEYAQREDDAEARLREVLLLPEDTVFILSKDGIFSPPMEGVQGSVQTTPESCELAQAEADVYIARAAWIPWVRTIQVGTVLRGGEALSANFVGASLEIPLFSLRQGSLALAEARLKEAQLAEQAKRNEARMGELRLRKSLEQARQAREHFELRLLAPAGAAVSEASAAHTSGQLSAGELESRRDYAESLEFRHLELLLEERLLSAELLLFSPP